jgi:hypothetical protein
MRFNLTITPIAENLDIITEYGLEMDLITIGFYVRLDKLNDKEEKKKTEHSPRAISTTEGGKGFGKQTSMKFDFAETKGSGENNNNNQLNETGQSDSIENDPSTSKGKSLKNSQVMLLDQQ